jgi:hypothetical protein
MRLLRSSSPMQLSGWSGAGCLIYLAGYLTTSFNVLSRGLQGLVFLLLVGLGMAVTWLAWERLNDGIRNETWTDDEIAPLRRLVERPVFTYIPWLMLASLVVMIIVPGPPHISLWFWPVIWANLTLGQLKVSVRPIVENRGGAGWLNAAPVRSEHWGERRVAGEESTPN